MKNDPWIKLILISLGSLVISLSLLWAMQQFNINQYNMMGNMNGQGMQQQIDNNQHNHNH